MLANRVREKVFSWMCLYAGMSRKRVLTSHDPKKNPSRNQINEKISLELMLWVEVGKMLSRLLPK
jgi:hypothetical protein